MAYTVSPVQQLVARVELATRRTRRLLERRRRALRSGQMHSAAAATAPRRPMAVLRPGAGEVDYLNLRWQRDLQSVRAQYETFYDRYDRLIGLLCLAAHEGLKPGQETEYQEHRDWFRENYGRTGRHLLPFLACATDPGSDPFRELFEPVSLAYLLETDGGNLIGKMMRTQDVLLRWDQTLRQEECAACPLPRNAECGEATIRSAAIHSRCERL